MTTEATGPTRVLVANRGEIAVRVMRTLRRLGMGSVAIYGDGDATARHVRAADTAVRVGGAELADSYLNGPAIIAAARASGASLIHPGYGFLSENAAFARACAAAGIGFVGPPPEAIEAMGDKIGAKSTVAAAGVPLLPGFTERPGHPMTDAELAEAAAEIGYPLLVKPSAGGGGKGMRLVHEPGDLTAAVAAARREALAAFGDATLLVERFVSRPRHIELQVLADAYGGVVHLGERECSLQRRHQKIVEEAPSPLLTPTQRAAMGEAAVAAAKACGYVGAGTVEFIVATTAEAAEPEYAFLEMNTRLQVEHPVTEAVASVAGRRGIDLVELQLRVALGEPLPFCQTDLDIEGHAVEARIYAEDPARGFLPTGGPVLLLGEADGTEARVDSGISEGTDITSAYDPMLAKVITWAPDRAGALDRMDTALARYTLLGCDSNVAFLRRLLCHPEVRDGRLSTDLTERLRRELSAADSEIPEEVYAAAALDRQLALEPVNPSADRFDIPDNWRVGSNAWTLWRLHASGHAPLAVRVRRATAATSPEDTYEVQVGEAPPRGAGARRGDGDRSLTVSYAGRVVRYARALDGDTLWLGHAGATWHLREEAVLTPMGDAETAEDGTLRSPMPGTVLSVAVQRGDRVTRGTAVLVIEAMKMEHAVSAPVDGVVTRIDVDTGQTVGMDAVLAVITPDAAAAPAGDVTTERDPEG
ncbi:ATP-binding protein [Salinactinospora qingdaonensis]|uniref:biotin carboxylase n=1 Tax=Salinactinospora qingdaonensis TaxID=702744 RepID=A0ABP7FB78_9ACTN